jgi:hypothetical protein
LDNRIIGYENVLKATVAALLAALCEPSRAASPPAAAYIQNLQTLFVAPAYGGEPPPTAIMSPGRQAVSEAIPPSWQRCSCQALVCPMS